MQTKNFHRVNQIEEKIENRIVSIINKFSTKNLPLIKSKAKLVETKTILSSNQQKPNLVQNRKSYLLSAEDPYMLGLSS